MTRHGLAFVFATLLLAGLVMLALAVGPQGFGWGASNTLLLLRAPRVLAALAAGLALGIGGAAQQGVFRNPLADPGLTGVFGGALFGIAVLLGLAPELAWQKVWLSPGAAFSGALATSTLLVRIGSRGSSARLLLTGLGLNAFTAAGTLVIATRSGESRELLTNGAYGDWLGMATLELIWLPALLCTAAALLLLTMARSFDLLAFGEDAAVSFGCDVHAVRRRAVLLTALAAAAATCLACRLLRLPPAADTLGRGLFPHAPLSAAAVTAVLGAPLFIWIARKRYE